MRSGKQSPGIHCTPCGAAWWGGNSGRWEGQLLKEGVRSQGQDAVPWAFPLGASGSFSFKAYSIVLQCSYSCLTLCDPMDCSLPGSSVYEISQQAYWSGLPFPSPGYLPDPGIEPWSPALEAGTLTSEPPGRAYLLMCSLKTVSLFLCCTFHTRLKGPIFSSTII